MTVARTALGVALAGVMLMMADPAAAQDFARFSGSYVYSGDDAQRQARLDAIEATVQQMSKLIRVFARGRIDKATPPPERYVLAVADGEITIGSTADGGLTSSLDGDSVVSEGDGGASLTVTRTIEGDCIRSYSAQHNGSGTDVFCLSADGNTLTVTVTIGSNQLPSDITYDLTYTRE